MGIDLQLQRSAVITGHVLADGNEPHTGTTVAAFSLHYVNGRQQVTVDAISVSNDLGEHRLFGLRPGRYYIAGFEPNRSVTTDRSGASTIRGIPPGDYGLLAWEDVEPDAWQDPEFLGPFENAMEKVTIAADVRLNQKLLALLVGTGQ